MKYKVDVTKYNKPMGNLRGSVSIVFDEKIKLTNINVCEDNDGELYVELPKKITQTNGKELIYNNFYPIGTFAKNLYINIIDTYKGVKNVRDTERELDFTYDIDVNILENPSSNILAYANITLCDAFVIKGLKIIDSKNGVFIGMPCQAIVKNNTVMHKDICYPVTADFRLELINNILDVYESKKALKSSKMEEINKDINRFKESIAYGEKIVEECLKKAEASLLDENATDRDTEVRMAVLGSMYYDYKYHKQQLETKIKEKQKILSERRVR